MDFQTDVIHIHPYAPVVSLSGRAAVVDLRVALGRGRAGRHLMPNRRSAPSDREHERQASRECNHGSGMTWSANPADNGSSCPV